MESLAAALNNNKQQDETNKLLKAILKGQETDRKDRKSAAAKTDRMSKLRAADRDPARQKKSMKDTFGLEKKSKSGLNGMLMKALGIGAIGGVLLAYFKSERFKKFVDEKILSPVGDVIKQGFSDFFLKDAQWKKDFRKGFVEFFTEDAQWKKDFRKGSVEFFTEDAQWKKDFRKGFIEFFTGEAQWKKDFEKAFEGIAIMIGNNIEKTFKGIGEFIMTLPGFKQIRQFNDFKENTIGQARNLGNYLLD